MRRAAVVAMLVLALAAAAAQAGSARSELGTCGTKTIAGGKWTVLFTRNLSCDTAFGVIAKLAGRKIPASHIYQGTYAGMRCFGGPNPGGLPRSIVCGTKKTHWFSSFKGL